MDAHSLELLEFGKLRDLLAGYAVSKPGKRRVDALAPSFDRAAVVRGVQLVTEIVDVIESRLPPPLGGLRDVEPHVRRTMLGVLLEISAVMELREVFELSGRVVEYRDRIGKDYPLLTEFLMGVKDHRGLVAEIDRVIDDRSRVRDDASPELRDVRRKLAHYEERIQLELKRLLRSDEVRRALRFAQATKYGDHHVLPVAVNHRQKVPGVVHRTSSTGETIYIEPSKVAEIAAESSVVRSAEEREVRRVLRTLCDRIRNESSPLLKSLDVLADLDLATAKAKFAADFNLTPPEILPDRPGGGGKLSLPNARHPLLESLFRSHALDSMSSRASTEPTDGEPSVTKTVVPVSVHLGGDFDLLIVTGPNTGGKTVALKTVGLLAVMAQCGMHIPASQGAKLPIFTDVLADIGDEQSLEQSLSTFSAHISRIAHILRRCGPTTLVLLDELGAGTEPGEGAALGRAVLDEIRSRGSRAIVTTHLNDLKSYALDSPRTENAAMEFDPTTLRPTHRLLVGRIGQSCAIEIARRLSLPPELISRAEVYLKQQQSSDIPDIQKVQEIRREAESAREAAMAAQVQAEELVIELRLKMEAVQQEASVSAELSKARETLRPGDTVRVARFGKLGVVKRVDVRKRQASVAVGAVEWQLSLDDLVPMAAP